MLVAGFALACWLPSPAHCDQKGTYAVGVGWSGSTINVDVPRAGVKEFTADGWGLAGRIGLSKRWGLEFSYRTLRDDMNFATGEEISLDLIGGHAYVTWLETKHSHWYAKMGLSWVDFEDEIPMAGTFSDEAIGPSIGLGVDWGSPRYAFFIDWDLTFVDLEVLPGEKESIYIGATIVGFIFKF
jgi:hypothetical protein